MKYATFCGEKNGDCTMLKKTQEVSLLPKYIKCYFVCICTSAQHVGWQAGKG